jgi:hypothetical protein
MKAGCGYELLDYNDRGTGRDIPAAVFGTSGYETDWGKTGEG